MMTGGHGVSAIPGDVGLALSVLGLGTVPVVFGYGVAFNTVSPGFRTRLHRTLGVAFPVLGSLSLSHSLMILGVDFPHPEIPFYQPLG